ncbi:type I-F CRISPR-associated protein Csy1 [Thalassolituus sp. ST750PaO-4]|uniref:type I-F CRISPR-associated protein Csy1 n=1 Tax=Thalassolituus sp. ST750PaO-4 TaxID=2742965 RepID=UPI001CE38080|nr:type I-F CRISPR-associated protein Csy1 [Thalassolituus sp. ST750PaO-4]MCA6059725.1 type I-F CRISPR-associated protein Csy1 [Thalassolituus sp. ST750PaO-4]
MEISTDRTQTFRQAITAFIEERRDAKLKGNNTDIETAAKYEYTTWLADAARRVNQIQAVTHVLKATHPDARGSSLHLAPNNLPQHREIGSHLLGDTFAEDIVGNAAALDVFKFLKTEVEGKRLFDWMQEADADLQAALSADAGTAQEWMQAFSSLIRAESQPVSHVAAKQLYWLVGEEPTDNAEYQLLQPLFSSALAHKVHADIQAARFGEENKLARQARRENSAYDGSYHDYRGLVVRKLGGTKPQNISQLNSERGGVNYLLASLPPYWNTSDRIKVLNVDSVFHSFYFFDDVADLLKALSSLLLSDPDAVKATREKREALEQALGQQLALYGESIRLAQEPGWSRHNDCRLPQCQRLWLDPERIELPPREEHQAEDEQFNAAYQWGDWPDEITGYFANWLNAQLHKSGLKTVGDVEYKHWAKQAIVDAHWPVPQQRRVPGGVA